MKRLVVFTRPAVTLALGVVFGSALPALAQTCTSTQYGTVTEGSYTIQNDKWGEADDPGGYNEVCTGNSSNNSWSGVILHMQQDFKGKLIAEQLASMAGISAATFRRKFKEMTSTTPLQYQKQLRLLEGRRLMILARTSMEQAAFEVGYESASHFSQDYARTFGRSPRYDVSRWQ